MAITFKRDRNRPFEIDILEGGRQIGTATIFGDEWLVNAAGQSFRVDAPKMTVGQQAVRSRLGRKVVKPKPAPRMRVSAFAPTPRGQAIAQGALQLPVLRQVQEAVLRPVPAPRRARASARRQPQVPDIIDAVFEPVFSGGYTAAPPPGSAPRRRASPPPPPPSPRQTASPRPEAPRPRPKRPRKAGKVYRVSTTVRASSPGEARRVGMERLRSGDADVSRPLGRGANWPDPEEG